jgi:hypothetical protein
MIECYSMTIVVTITSHLKTNRNKKTGESPTFKTQSLPNRTAALGTMDPWHMQVYADGHFVFPVALLATYHT